MLQNARFGLLTGALFAGLASTGCSAPTAATPHLVHAHAEVALAPSAPSSSAAKTAEIKPMNVTHSSGVQIVELNGVYQGCVEMSGAWSVAVNGNDVALDNPPLTVVQADFNCQLLVTSVRADQIYTAASPIPTQMGPEQSSSFSAVGTSEVAFYASAWNMDPGYFGDFTLFLFYSPGPNQTPTGVNATYTTNPASPAQAEQVPAPDYTVDLSQMTIQTDANNWVTSASGPATFNFGSNPGSGYVIDDGTLSANPTFGELDALYKSQTPTPITWYQGFSIDASALSIQWNMLPLVRSVVIGNDWMNGVSGYQNVTITFEPASNAIPDGEKRFQSTKK